MLEEQAAIQHLITRGESPPSGLIECLISFFTDEESLTFRDASITLPVSSSHSPSLKLKIHEEPEAQPRAVSSQGGQGGGWMVDAGLCLVRLDEVRVWSLFLFTPGHTSLCLVRCCMKTKLSVLLPAPNTTSSNLQSNESKPPVNSRILDGGASSEDLSSAIHEGFRVLSDYLSSPSPSQPSQPSQLSSSLSQVAYLITPPREGGRACLVTSGSSGTLSDFLPPTIPINPYEPALTASPLLLPPSPSSSSPSAPLFHYTPHEPPPSSSSSSSSSPLKVELTCPLTLDLLLLVPTSLPTSELGPRVLTPALLSHLSSIEKVMISQGGVCEVTPHHYLPPQRSHLVTLLYPRIGRPSSSPSSLSSAAQNEADEAALIGYRKEVHGLLGLPLDRPALRFNMSLFQTSDQGKGPAEGGGGKGQDRLVDVHLGLNPPGPSPSTISLVQGSYSYHHYLQDRFDDNGWGCAYRSLQTLCSWFRHQRYTNKPSPSHVEIQSMLVKMGDKEKSFIGSRQWIGAIELSYILDDYLNVSCKIITVNKGSEIPSHAR